jgi:hypothetical protein
LWLLRNLSQVKLEQDIILLHSEIMGGEDTGWALVLSVSSYILLPPVRAWGNIILTITLTSSKIRESRKTFMNKTPNLRPWIALLLAGGALFPIAVCVIFGIGAMLTAMGDASGGAVLSRISLALAIFWVLDLIALVLAQGLNFLFGGHNHGDHSDESKS